MHSIQVFFSENSKCQSIVGDRQSIAPLNMLKILNSKLMSIDCLSHVIDWWF